MAALGSRCRHYIFVLWFLLHLSSIFFYSSPNPSHRRLNVYHTCANLECRSENVLHAVRWKCRIQKFACRRTTLSGYIFATKAHIDNRKKNLLNSNTSCTCQHNMANFGPLKAGISSGVCGTPANFNGFCILAALLNSTLVVGVSQTLRTEQRVPPIFDRAAITLGIGPHF